MPKLTKRVVEAAKPDPSRDLFLWDTQLAARSLGPDPEGQGAACGLRLRHPMAATEGFQMPATSRADQP